MERAYSKAVEDIDYCRSLLRNRTADMEKLHSAAALNEKNIASGIAWLAELEAQMALYQQRIDLLEGEMYS